MPDQARLVVLYAVSIEALKARKAATGVIRRARGRYALHSRGCTRRFSDAGSARSRRDAGAGVGPAWLSTVASTPSSARSSAASNGTVRQHSFRCVQGESRERSARHEDRVVGRRSRDSRDQLVARRSEEHRRFGSALARLRRSRRCHLHAEPCRRRWTSSVNPQRGWSTHGEPDAYLSRTLNPPTVSSGPMERICSSSRTRHHVSRCSIASMMTWSSCTESRIRSGCGERTTASRSCLPKWRDALVGAVSAPECTGPHMWARTGLAAGAQMRQIARRK